MKRQARLPSELERIYLEPPLLVGVAGEHIATGAGYGNAITRLDVAAS